MRRCAWYFLIILSCFQGSSDDPSDDNEVKSFHSTINVGGPVEQIFRPSNGLDDAPTQDENYMTGLGQLRDAVATAALAGKRIRAYGSRWSLSNVFYTSELAISSGDLNYVKVGMDASHVTGVYQDLKDRLVMVQAGVRIQSLNERIFADGLSITTSGSGDHQRLIGAISTDTHMSNFEVGTMSQMVRAVHILLGPGREVLIQGLPIFTDDFATNFLDGAQLITDMDLLNAVSVGVGSMGIIHAMIIETVPLYLLERQTKPAKVRQFRELVASNYTALSEMGFVGYGQGESSPHIIYIRANPFWISDKDKSMSLTVYRKVEDGSNGRNAVLDREMVGEVRWDTAAFRGIGILANPITYFLATLFNFVFRFYMGFICKFLILFLDPPFRYGEQIQKYHPDFFRMGGGFTEYSIDPLPGLDLEFSMNADRLADAYDVVTKSIKECPFAARFLLMRIAVPVDALLSTAAFGPLTGYLDIVAQADRLVFSRAIPCVNKMIKNMDESGIEYRMHLGKYHPENAEWFSNSFGADTVQAFKAERAKLLDTAELRDRFASEWLDAVGLNGEP